MEIKIKKLDKFATEPVYGTEGAAAFDLSVPGTDPEHPALAQPVMPKSAGVFGTGLAFDIPEEYAMLIFSRSGHGFKNDVRLANCVGVIDSDYTGEVKVKLTNDGHEGFYVKPGDRIAQAMVLHAPRVKFTLVEGELKATERGASGFGSTGS